MQEPNLIKLANLPTPITYLERFSKGFEKADIYMKRDDYTGFELSGNKIRKLEYIMYDVMENNCNVLITCGGVQSNHCRATAAVAAKCGLQSHLVLKGVPSEPEGNMFLNTLFKAQVEYITADEYANRRMDYMKIIQESYAQQGKKAYIIPEGASNGLGVFGYYSAMQEILKQEEELGIRFDTICVATGSAGTYAGLYLANACLKLGKRILGINVYDQSRDFHRMVPELMNDALSKTQNHELMAKINLNEIEIANDYIEGGYGHSTPEEIAFIKAFAHTEGILLDPVYTGKAMYGLKQELLKEEAFKEWGNVLFIHTGGQFGTLAKKACF